MQGTRSITLANVSRWKLGLLAIPSIGLGVAPNLPGVANGLTRSAFYYSTPLGVAFRLIASGTLILIGLTLLLALLLTLISSTRAVWLDGSDLKWGRLGTKHMRVTELGAVNFDPAMNRIRLDRRESGKPEYIAISGLRSSDAPEALIEKLRQLIQVG